MRAALAAAILLAAAPAQAYVRTVSTSGAPMYWNRTVMQITAYLGDPPPDISADEVMAAVQAAAAAWTRSEVACTSVDIRVDSTDEAEAPVALDGVSRMTFRRQEWCKEPRLPNDKCYAPEAMAVTSVFARKETGEILEADMEVNAVGTVWSDLEAHPDEASRAQDLQNTLTHEFGHFIGLDHTCLLNGEGAGRVDDHGRPVPDCIDAPPNIRETTMFAVVGAGDLERRTLSDDDMNAVCDVYPPLDAELVAENAGCSTGGGRPSGGAALLLSAGALIAVRRRRRATPPPPTTR